MTTKSSDVDILVIGAGPAGCAAGIEAARNGARVCVVDRARFPRPKPCGDALSDRAVDVIRDLGCGEMLTTLPRAVLAGSSAIFPNGKFIRRSRKTGYVIGRFDLDNMLLQALENEGAEVRQETNVRNLLFEGGRVSGAEGNGWKLRAGCVIAADGTGSVAWRTLNKKAPPAKTMAIAVTAYYRNMPDAEFPGDAEIYFEHDLPLGYGWVFPPVNGLTNVGVGLRVDLYKREGIPLNELLHRFVARHPERFEGSEMLSGPFTWSLPLATARLSISCPGLLASGDAARFVDPLNGEGIWQALESGRMAGRVAAKAVTNGGLDKKAITHYRKHCYRAIGIPSIIRGNARRAVELILRLRLYRSRLIRKLIDLAWA